MSAVEHYRAAADGAGAALEAVDPTVRAILLAEAMREAQRGTDALAAVRGRIIVQLMDGPDKLSTRQVGALLDLSAERVSQLARAERKRAVEAWQPGADAPEPRAVSSTGRLAPSAVDLEAWKVALEDATRGALFRREAPAYLRADHLTDIRIMRRWGSEEARSWAGANPPPRALAAHTRAWRKLGSDAA